MKQFLIYIFLIISFAANCQTVDSARQVLTKIINHTEKASLYRNKVDWNTVKVKAFELAKGAKTVTDLVPSLKYLLSAIEDDHGRIFFNNQVIAYYYGDLKEHQKGFNPEIYNQVQSGQTYQFEAKNIDKNIGYVRIVGLPMGDNEQMSRAIDDAICKVAAKKIDKWIVDLRYNGGGNMFPMVEGLTSIIGDGNVGGSTGLTNEENAVWKIENGDFYYDDYSVQLKNNCQFKKMPKVAVLTSLYTASSGEALAVILKGRPNTRFFGEKTLGMITVTDWEIIDANTTMTISVSYYKDRNGKVYNQFVDPDEETPFVREPLSAEDTCAQKAVEWLKSK